jgi:hypothetical protein
MNQIFLKSQTKAESSTIGQGATNAHIQSTLYENYNNLQEKMQSNGGKEEVIGTHKSVQKLQSKYISGDPCTQSFWYIQMY